MTEQMKRKQYETIILTEVPDLSTENSDSKQILALVNLANELVELSLYLPTRQSGISFSARDRRSRSISSNEEEKCIP